MQSSYGTSSSRPLETGIESDNYRLMDTHIWGRMGVGYVCVLCVCVCCGGGGEMYARVEYKEERIEKKTNMDGGRIQFNQTSVLLSK